MKPILCYIKGALDYSLQYKVTNIDGVMKSLHGYADANWAGDLTTRKSTSGYVFQIGSSAVPLISKHQSIVTLSSTEAEYVALSNATQEVIWLGTFLNGKGFDQAEPKTMFEDNQGTMKLAKDPSHHLQVKHIDIKFHHVRDAVATKKIYLKYCPTQKTIPDLLKKGRARPQFEKLLEELRVTKLTLALPAPC